jgi:pSer/pThr/pTyr-binding forkhead associated (FHA) protein
LIKTGGGEGMVVPEIVFVALKFATLLALFLFIALVVRSLFIDLLPAPQRARAAAARVARSGKPGRPYLRVASPAGGRARRYDLEAETVIGRGQECQVCLEDEFVSQLHARIVKVRDGYILEDLGSTNGTYINGNRINYPVGLRHGDRVGIGGTVLEFRSR